METKRRARMNRRIAAQALGCALALAFETPTHAFRIKTDGELTLNYDNHELVSGLVKVGHDLDLRYRNFGFFGRVLYFYDAAIDRKDGLPAEAKKRLRGDFELYDAFVRGQWEPGGRRLDARAGNQ